MRRGAAALRLVKEEVLSRLGHELRTPLNSVIGLSQVLKTNRAGNQRAQDLAMLEAIRASGERLLELMEDLFDISTGPADAAVALQPVDVAAAATAALRHVRDRATAKGLTLDLRVEAFGSVGLDETRLVRLLRKLLCNAVKFTARGGVVVTVKGRAGTQAPWAIIVQDTGIGIAPELQAEIFEPFIQAEAGTRRSFEGAGLGLPVARRLAEAMGCTLTLDSQVGIGSRFILLLPSRPGIR